MARFTVADCMQNIKNRYELTLVASVRARQMEHGSETVLTNNENDKPPVLALREISDGIIDNTILNTVG